MVAAKYEVWERDDPRYPAPFADLSNPPKRVWVLGKPDVLERTAIAVVGTRHATSNGLRVARNLGAALGKAGACVVSGLAAGIDAAAHSGALEANGRTCAVLGTGIDIAFPRANRQLQDRIARDGLLLTEYPPGQPATPWTFPRRNRLIAALARATIVVEAGEKSGALITANIANELGRTVAAVPWSIESRQAAGSNALLRDGATALTAIADAPLLIGARVVVSSPPPELAGDEAKVWDALSEGACDVDTIALKANVTVAQCLTAITKLEMAKLVVADFTGELRRA